MANNVVVCKVCGKVVKASASVNATCGARCSTLASLGVNAGLIASSKQAYAVTSIPTGFISIAALHLLIANNPQHGCTVARMVACTGSDRPYMAVTLHGVKPFTFANPIAVPLIATGSKTRMLPGWLGTQAGMQAMATGNFTGAPKTHALQLSIFAKAKAK
jgi:hypothetical protein